MAATRLEIACYWGLFDDAHKRVMQLHADIFQECVAADNVQGFHEALIAAGFNPDDRSYHKTLYFFRSVNEST